MHSQSERILRVAAWTVFGAGCLLVAWTFFDWVLGINWLSQVGQSLLVELGVGFALAAGGYLGVRWLRKETYEDARQNLQTPVINLLNNYIIDRRRVRPSYDLWREEHTINSAGDTNVIHTYRFQAVPGPGIEPNQHGDPLPFIMTCVAGPRLRSSEEESIQIRVEGGGSDEELDQIDFVKCWRDTQKRHGYRDLIVVAYLDPVLQPDDGSRTARIALTWPRMNKLIAENRPTPFEFVFPRVLSPIGRFEYVIVLDESLRRQTEPQVELLPKGREPAVLDQPEPRRVGGAWLIEGGVDNPPADEEFGILVSP